MTKIATIGNLYRNVRSNISSLNDNRGQRPEAEMPFFNYLTVTDGEASMQLADQRLWLYESIFPEKQKTWKKGRALIANALYQKNNIGVHGATPFLGLLDNDLRFVGQAIRDAKRRTAPASDVYIGRQDIRQGLNPEIRIAGINGDNTIFDDVLTAYRGINPSCFYQVTNKMTDKTRWEMAGGECSASFELMVALNTQIPKTSHNGLYIFMPSEDANNPALTPPLTVSKVADHLKYLQVLQNKSRVSQTNLTTWIKNAVMHKNSFNGVPSITPEDNIKLLRANPTWSTLDNMNNTAQDKIGDPFTIIVILVVCIKGLVAVIQVLKDREPTALEGLNEIAARSFDFTASGTDFKGASGGNGQTDEQKCNARQGYRWNTVTKTCDKITTGGGGGGDDDPPPPKEPSEQWINGVPNAVTATGAAVVLGLATGVIKV